MTMLRCIANACLALSAVLAIVLVMMDEASSTGAAAAAAASTEQTCTIAPVAAEQAV